MISGERLTREEALDVVCAIESLARTSRRDDVHAHEDIRYLVDRLREAPALPGGAREKVESVATWVDILFSDDKRKTYGGDREVTELLLDDCERVRVAIRGD